ncbi:hypothetical protein NH44784_014171 [Achromobacter xylosoxidans NH44784-1996]|nr:hypothetical protein NH44784_014171 [Achromobacter xylosoxidans NH44784-1996]
MHKALELECGTLCPAVCASPRRIFMKCFRYRTRRNRGDSRQACGQMYEAPFRLRKPLSPICERA